MVVPRERSIHGTACASDSQPIEGSRDPLSDRATGNLHVVLAHGARDRFLRRLRPLLVMLEVVRVNATESTDDSLETPRWPRE